MRKRKQNKQKRGRSRNQYSISASPDHRFLFGAGLDNRANTVVRSGYYDFTIPVGLTNPHSMSFLLTGFYIDSVFTSYGGANELANLYDFYRYDRVQVTGMYNYNSAAVTGGTAQTLPFFFSAIDVNDATVSSITDIMQLASCEVVMGGNPTNNVVFNKTFTPRAQLQVYAGVASAYAEAPLDTWYNTSSLPLHYGFKWAADNTATTSTTGNIGYLRLFVKSFFSAKQPK